MLRAGNPQSDKKLKIRQAAIGKSEPTMDLTRQLISFVGALLILIAYAGHQLGWINSRGAGYNILNAAGSAILFWIALHPFQIGFIVLEGVWTAISLWALIRPRPV
jgi:hypothetical protein